MGNKSHQQQIKKLQGDLLEIYSEANEGEASKKLLAKKENNIQFQKKKLKIPTT